MTPPEVEVDKELAALAAQVAEARGETVEIVIQRALTEYVGDRLTSPSSKLRGRYEDHP